MRECCFHGWVGPPYYTVLYCTVIYYTILYYTKIHFTILNYTMAHYIILYCIVLYCTVIVLYDTTILTMGSRREAVECCLNWEKGFKKQTIKSKSVTFQFVNERKLVF